MFNRGKINQESSKEVGWNGSSGCFRDPVGNGFPIGIRKGMESKYQASF